MFEEVAGKGICAEEGVAARKGEGRGVSGDRKGSLEVSSYATGRNKSSLPSRGLGGTEESPSSIALGQ